MVNDISLSLPSWYKAERETAKTLSKLTDNLEITFYLNNSDPFIRRLAILRVGQLKRKDSYVLLSSILDDRLENEENRKLAALFMQKLNHDLQLGFFISNSTLLSGEEDLDKLLNIVVTDPFPDIRFHFENALIESQLNFDNEFLKSNLDEKVYDFPFAFKDWLSHCSAGILLDIKKCVKKLARNLFIECPKKFFLGMATLPNRIALHNKMRKEKKEEDLETMGSENLKIKKVRPYKPRAYTYRPPLSSRLKVLLKKILNTIFLPFKVIFHFKWVIIITLMILYSLFSFTKPGQLYLFRVNPKVYYLNTNFLKQTKSSVIKIINSNEVLAAVLNTSSPSVAVEPVPETLATTLIVTAPKGLYLRSEPISDSEKLILMKKNTTVEFMSDEITDSSGVKWFKIRVSETTGWANAQWLGEV